MRACEFPAQSDDSIQSLGSISHPYSTWFVGWAAVPPGKKERKAEWRREAPMIYGSHYRPNNYMLPYNRPLL